MAQAKRKSRPVRPLPPDPPDSNSPDYESLRTEYLAKGNHITKVPIGFSEGFTYKQAIIANAPFMKKKKGASNG